MTAILVGFESVNDVFDQFKVDDWTRNGAQILYACYDQENWGSGSAFVIYRHDEYLMEAHGDHCSCYGLEGQWDGEITSREALLYRWDNGGLTVYAGGNQYAVWEGMTRAFLESL